MTTATVKLWGTTIGYVSMDQGERFARFEYDPDFVKTGIELAPLMMPAIERRIYQFSDLHPRAFHGLPGLLADSLPDKYGNKLIDVWLAQTGRESQSFNAVDRLCYTGTRGMGALEFEPSMDTAAPPSQQLEVQELVELASMAFASKQNLQAKFNDQAKDQDLFDILSLGTSAGGARAKAVIAFDPSTSIVRSGQLNLPSGYQHWLIKFDGVEYNGDWGVADPAGYGLLEYSYYEIAKRCQVTMMESRLFSENGRNHFMTKRFDRDEAGNKQFVQTLGALAHFDYWESGYYSYEQLFMTLKQLGLPQTDIEQQFRRTVFNIVGCNQDDHVKNFALIMNRQGDWRLSPAYDLCHAEGSDFTKNHQLSINGKTNNFELADLKHLADYAGLPRGRDKRILEEVVSAFAQWPHLAKELNIPARLQHHVESTLRLKWH
ncbi:type II toxin-antitoxin system HipA family toxin [Arenicella xantha]|uniref:Serine/threonine-protein kinase HipA n=1 Tax=Arenicella xantha TaxID=644221 RepID=A0A395JLE8_9GAMM|nr:type II toxin-antitoxin system HipA family toxin [Arenicella xantha]RBP51245.1 serine/threonine-protein kinase HipA [Arenicella xantha]